MFYFKILVLLLSCNVTFAAVGNCLKNCGEHENQTLSLEERFFDQFKYYHTNSREPLIGKFDLNEVKVISRHGNKYMFIGFLLDKDVVDWGKTSISLNFQIEQVFDNRNETQVKKNSLLQYSFERKRRDDSPFVSFHNLESELSNILLKKSDIYVYLSPERLSRVDLPSQKFSIFSGEKYAVLTRASNVVPLRKTSDRGVIVYPYKVYEYLFAMYKLKEINTKRNNPD